MTLKNANSKFDYIIVGQGLAGSTLAMQMLLKKKRILVLDSFNPNSSSQIAAGIFNPITGRKMVKTWMADALFPYLISFYRKIETLTGTSFLHEKPIYRPFLTCEEQNDWMGRSTDPAYVPFITQVVVQPTHANFVHDSLGGLTLTRSGWLDIPCFVNAVKEYLTQNAQYQQGFFEEDKLLIGKEEVSYGPYAAKKIIFCNGVKAMETKWFKNLPFRPVKGEILEITSEGNPEIIYNRGVFILKQNNELYKVGATYENHDLSLEPTKKARTTLVEKLVQLYTKEYHIQKQPVGIRPATKDRKPFIGVHPHFKQIGIFNGLGAKGVSLAPWFSDHFLKHLENGENLNKEVDIIRYLDKLI